MGALLSSKGRADGEYTQEAHNNQTDVDRSWLQLPNNVMVMIIERLDIINRLRMYSVCKAWKSLAMQKDISIAIPQLPWMVLDHNTHCELISFFDMSLGKILNFNLPNSLHGGRCFGSSRGWLVIATGSKRKPQISLLNPISKEIVTLPSITTISFYYDYLDDLGSSTCDFESFIIKIELSSQDASTCTISTITNPVNDRNCLAICKAADERWTVYEDLADIYLLDILFYKGMLYVLHYDTVVPKTVELIKTIKLVADVPLSVSFAETTEVKEGKDYYNIKNGVFAAYLVESNGGLFIIHKVCDTLYSEIEIVMDSNGNEVFQVIVDDADNGNFELNDEAIINEFVEDNNNEVLQVINHVCQVIYYVINRVYRVINNVINHVYRVIIGNVNINELFEKVIQYTHVTKFKVYNMDHNVVNSLDSQVLFVGNNARPVSLLARDFDGLKGNCIHFLADEGYPKQQHNQYENNLHASRESGIFCLDDQRIVRNYPSVRFPNCVSWFTPHL